MKLRVIKYGIIENKQDMNCRLKRPTKPSSKRIHTHHYIKYLISEYVIIINSLLHNEMSSNHLGRSIRIVSL